MEQKSGFRLLDAFFLLLLLALSIAFYQTLQPFWLDLLVAAIMASLLEPLFERYLKWFRNRRPLAGVAAVISFLVLIGVPVVILGLLLSSELINFASQIVLRVPEIEDFLTNFINSFNSFMSGLSSDQHAVLIAEYMEQFEQGLQPVLGTIDPSLLSVYDTFIASIENDLTALASAATTEGMSADLPSFMASVQNQLGELMVNLSLEPSWASVTQFLDQVQGDVQVLLDTLAMTPKGPINPITINQGELAQQAINSISGVVTSVAERSFSGIANMAFHVFITVLLMFFFFTDGDKLYRGLKRLAPLSNHDLDLVLNETQKITRATMKSTLIVGFIEGVFGTVLLMIFGVPSALVWGMLMMISSSLPPFGINNILMPIGIGMIIGGNTWGGIAVLVLGQVEGTLMQNVFKPRILGEQSGLHPGIVLLATIGGITWLGLLGVLIGPVVASLFLVMWGQFGRRFSQTMARRSISTSDQSVPEASERDPELAPRPLRTKGEARPSGSKNQPNAPDDRAEPKN